MKSHVRTLAATAVVSALSLMSGALAAEEPTGLVGWWTFDDGTGRDLSGGGHDAVLGGARIYPLGEGRACLELMPDTGPLRIPASENSPLALSRGSICFWLNKGWKDSGTVLEYDNDAVQLRIYRRHLQPRFKGDGDFRYATGILDYDWPKYDMREWAFYPHERAAVGDSEWHHFVVTYDDRGKRVIGWRDGQLISVVDLSATDMEALVRDGLKEISTGKGFVGYLDDIRIYDKVLNDAEARGIYNATKSVYAGRQDTNPIAEPSQAYEPRPQDETLYRAWLQYSPRSERPATRVLERIVAEGADSTVQTAAAELRTAVKSMFALEPSVHSSLVSGPRVVLGTARTSSWIRQHVDALGLDRVRGDGFVIRVVGDRNDPTLVVAGRVPAGVIFGTFDLIRRIQLGQEPEKIVVVDNPQVPIRMVNHWTTFDGFKHDNWYGGNSIFNWRKLRTGDTKLLRDWVRMLSCAGWNAICPTNVNWDYRNNFLEHLDEVEILAGILRDYGMRLYWCPSYLLALEKETANRLYERVPDFGGYMLKLGSEKQNGDPRSPMVNRIADTLLPHGGQVLVRGFIYGNSRYGPEPYRHLMPCDVFVPEDGKFRENVIILPKSSAGDWDFSAPIPAFDGALRKTRLGSELIIEEDYPSFWFEKWKWWLEQDNYRDGPGSLNRFGLDCIMAVTLNRASPAWADSPLNMVNFYGLGRIAWNPDLSVDDVYAEWIRLTFGDAPEVLETIRTILLLCDDTIRKLYLWRGYRGVWLDPKDEGLVEKKTPYVINRDGIGPVSGALRERLLDQYAPGLREVYEDTDRSEEYLLAFHFTDHDHRLSIGRTVIEDVYGNMDEAVELADRMVELWKRLETRIDENRFRYTLQVMTEFTVWARDHRDKMAASFEQYTGRQRSETIEGLSPSGLASVDTFSVRHFGAVGDGLVDDSLAVSRAIGACEAAGGGTVFVPTGIYAAGTIQLKSNVTLAIDNGAVLRAQLQGTDLEDVKVYGPGVLTGSTQSLSLSRCNNVEVRNLKIQGGGQAIVASGCRDLVIDNVAIHVDGNGLSLSQCRDVEVLDCSIDTLRYENGHPTGGGNAIELRGKESREGSGASQDITVRNGYLASGGSALQIGSEATGSFSDIRFENIRIRRTGGAGIRITSSQGSQIEGVLCKGIRMEQTFAPVFMSVSGGGGTDGERPRASLRNVTFENITATDCYSRFRSGEVPSVLWGMPDAPIEGVEFKNVSITVKGGHPVIDGDARPDEYDKRFPYQVGTIPGHAWYLRHVTDVNFTDCDFRFEKDDGRPAFVLDDVEGIVLQNTSLPIGSECSSRIAVRNQATDLTIRDCQGMPDVRETASDKHY